MTRCLLGLLGLAGALGAAAAPARAQQRLDTTIAVRSGARLELVNVAGSVTIRAGRRQAFRINVEYDRARIDIQLGSATVEVRTIQRHGGEAIYVIEVPTGTPLDVKSVSGDIDVRGVCGETELGTLSGKVTLDCARGNVELSSVSGDVRASDVRGRIEAGSTSGDVTIANAQADVSAHSVSGDVSLRRVDGSDVSAQSVSGDIAFAGPVRETGRYRFQSHSGDITVRPDGPNLNATISVRTFSGDLESDFPITLTQGGRIRPREFEFTVGGGGARLTLESFSGTIYLRRGAGSGREE